MELIFATNNQNKVNEINALLPEHIQVKSLKEIGFAKELSEPYFTLEENAKTKAMQLYDAFGIACFAEDSGLFIESLNGEPGVLSARYSGQDATDAKNIEKVLAILDHENNRNAYFKTIIHLILNKQHYTFSGTCEGQIAVEKSGTEGFGYDPIFIPQGYDKTFASLGFKIKNNISHRSKATAKFIRFLNQYPNE